MNIFMNMFLTVKHILLSLSMNTHPEIMIIVIC